MRMAAVHRARVKLFAPAAQGRAGITEYGKGRKGFTAPKDWAVTRQGNSP